MGYFIIYQTTNKINGKIYVGKHETDDLNDGYLGSGKLLWKAIEKYGIENFERKVLFFCESEDELNTKEKEIVNEDFVAREDTYNLKVGGDGGWDFVNYLAKNDIEYIKARKERMSEKNNPMYGKNIKDFMTNEKYNEWLKKMKNIGEKRIGKPSGALGHHWKLLDETKQKQSKNNCSHRQEMKEFHSKIVTEQNKGRVWCHSPDTLENKFVYPDEIPEGWVKGRIYRKRQKKS